MKASSNTIVLALLLSLFAGSAVACTSLLVSRKASDDGSVMITYTCDGEFHPHLEYHPAADYPEGDSLEITDWYGNVLGKIPQVRHTYAVMGLMNEHQLAIGETTFGGRDVLRDPEGLLHYWDLMILALQRARTAREAIKVITGLVEEHGYRSTGESFSIADAKEVWIMEMIGMGPDSKGAVWVARKVPDGYICAHANKARIGKFPLNDKDNCMFHKNVISFAVEKGYYDPESGDEFHFNEAYDPSTPKNLKWGEGRVWSIFRRASPSQNFSPDYWRGVKGAERYPLWIKPDDKISFSGVLDLMRDHYEGTPYDMTVGVDAGPYGSPERWRPLDWTLDSTVFYSWERPVSTFHTAFSFVSQSRSWLPDGVGGVYWYGLDNTYTTCYMPLYCCITEVPHSFTVGGLSDFSWESAWWVFNFAANFANLKYSFMVKDIIAVQAQIEGGFIRMQPAVEDAAVKLLKEDKDLMVRYLTDYSVRGVEQTVKRWRKLGEDLIVKYNDGYVKNEKGRPTDAGYPERWLKDVIKLRPRQFVMPEWEDKE
ncbi:MAG: hypothetical protein GF307_08660 [candidate division Zixibacteria bacterium]|nr:hypothetical protein [candidate division Zixibacteria bacterium]